MPAWAKAARLKWRYHRICGSWLHKEYRGKDETGKVRAVIRVDLESGRKTFNMTIDNVVYSDSWRAVEDAKIAASFIVLFRDQGGANASLSEALP